MLRRHISIVLGLALTVASTVVTALAAGNYKILHRFGNGERGISPEGGLIFDSSGNLYGTTFYGGTSDGGTIFELVSDGDGRWIQKVLHDFCSDTGCAKGEYPLGNLVFDASGNLYGATMYGGIEYGGGGENGLVFELIPGQNGIWTEKVIHAFCPQSPCLDGLNPTGSLLFDSAGNLYGTTSYGGAHGQGVVFQLVPGASGTWTENVLYSFCNPHISCRDGANPQPGLVFDSAGNLYGTTWVGGESAGCRGRYPNTCGVVFELTPQNNRQWTERVLHAFNYHDGAYPFAGLVFDGAGNLYGTTPYGGAFGSGVVFELVPGADGSWAENIIHHFDAVPHLPASTPVFDNAGNLYGTALRGGGQNCGTVFKLTPGQNGVWTQTVLHTFTGPDTGCGPLAGVILDSAGNLYGTASGNYGSDGDGLVYEITP